MRYCTGVLVPTTGLSAQIKYGGGVQAFGGKRHCTRGFLSRRETRPADIRSHCAIATRATWLAANFWQW